MAKSKIAKQTNSVKRVRNSQNVVPLNLTLPYKNIISNKLTQFDVSHLLHLGCNCIFRSNPDTDSGITRTVIPR